MLRIAKGASLPQPIETDGNDDAFRPPILDLGTHGEHYVSPSELARYWRVSADTIYRDIKKGALPVYRIGSSGTIRIRIEDARRYGRPA